MELTSRADQRVLRFGQVERIDEFLDGVDGGSKWRAGTRYTEVRLDGWCEGRLGHQRNDGGGCTTMREKSERMVSPGTYVTE